MDIKKSLFFIASSWKQRDRVRALAKEVRKIGFPVFDFTDPACRKTAEMAPEKCPELFDPEKQTYWSYLHEHQSFWYRAVEENRENIEKCSRLLLLLPCGIDATADWAYAVGKGKETYIIGEPAAGERSPVHFWADGWFPDEESFLHHLCEWVFSGEDCLSFPDHLTETRMINILAHLGPMEMEECVAKTMPLDSDTKRRHAKKIMLSLIDQGIITVGLDLKVSLKK
ncbi:MAG: hypothetical protein HYZ69_00265 [Candidatus Colwellbacteria bacterium]|nr:hypothetical protein [Candidatus Colwellbacteria bacterium]